MSAEEITNPLAVGLSEPVLPQPCSLVIFGGAGDLSRRKLLPAIYNLGLDGVLPANFAVLGFSVEEMDDAGYRGFAWQGVERFSRQALDEEHWPNYERQLFFQSGSFDDPAAYKALKQRLEEIEPQFGIPGNRVFYLAIPPRFIGMCAQHLKAAGLIQDETSDGPFSRIIVE
ncbi:MAG: glucose-6-phosphate dehydrogenase, partial [Gammaproteobacteria bacterium]